MLLTMVSISHVNKYDWHSRIDRRNMNKFCHLLTGLLIEEKPYRSGPCVKRDKTYREVDLHA